MNNLSTGTKRKTGSMCGFTMIELIVVIIILGILAAFALPKYLNIEAEATQSAVDSVAASLNTATAINFAKRKANINNPSSQEYDNCTVAAALLPGGTLPTGYSITSLGVAANAEAICTVIEIDSGLSATYVGLGVS